jgi:hypothetical protein
MPGFFTIEQWKPLKRGGKAQWVPLLHLDGRQSLTKAIEAIEIQGKPGFFRVVQTQRQIWAEVIDGKLKLRKHHAMSPEGLMRTAAAFERDKGRWPKKQKHNA